jgi:hypothetical protein
MSLPDKYRSQPCDPFVTIEADDPRPWTDYPNCPDCHANVWCLGPRGAAAVNIRCTSCG